MAVQTAAAVASSLAAQAAARGVRAPVALRGADARAWVVLSSGGPARAGDALMLDEYGDLWWARVDGRAMARVTRPCWPEESMLCLEAIRAAMEHVLGAVAAGNAN